MGKGVERGSVWAAGGEGTLGESVGCVILLLEGEGSSAFKYSNV